MMQAPKEMQDIYQRYWTELDREIQNRKLFDGALGLGGGLAAAPCHERLAHELESALNDLALSASSNQAKDVLHYIYNIPLEYQEMPAAYWMLTAVHSLTLPLIKRLNSNDAATLQKEYTKAYPPRERLLPQKRVLSALKEQS